MAGGYIDGVISTNPDELSDSGVAYLQGVFSGWRPSDAQLEVALLVVMARMAAEARDVASDVPRSIFRWYGQSLLQVPFKDATHAAAPSTWTLADDAGYTIAGGTLVALTTTGDEAHVFQVAEDTVVAPGDTSATDVTLVAVDAGVQASGIATQTATLVQPLSWVTSVVTTEVTSGGDDAETDDEYLDRLAQRLQLMSPRPILAPDFAVLARDVDGVHRALAIDGYNPDDDTDDNERMVAVGVVSESGTAVATGVLADVEAYLEAMREQNFVVNVVDPEFTTLTIVFTATTADGYLASDVEARAEAALDAFIDPARWAGGGESPPEWRDEPIVRRLDLVGELYRVAGLEHVTALTINAGTADVTMTGRFPLPDPASTVSGTVT